MECWIEQEAGIVAAYLLEECIYINIIPFSIHLIYVHCWTSLCWLLNWEMVAVKTPKEFETFAKFCWEVPTNYIKYIWSCFSMEAECIMFFSDHFEMNWLSGFITKGKFDSDANFYVTLFTSASSSFTKNWMRPTFDKKNTFYMLRYDILLHRGKLILDQVLVALKITSSSNSRLNLCYSS